MLETRRCQGHRLDSKAGFDLFDSHRDHALEVLGLTRRFCRSETDPLLASRVAPTGEDRGASADPPHLEQSDQNIAKAPDHMADRDGESTVSGTSLSVSVYYR